MIVFGRSANNRRLDALLKALAEFPERDRFRLHIYGQMGKAASLQDLISSLNLKRLVMLHGLVTEDELERALDKSHLAINLRYPTMGEASGSQMRIWSHALPTLVTKVGWYATLPAEAVAHVRVEREIEDIQAHLRAFLDDPEKFRAMGLEGRRILKEEHSPESYARALVSFAAQAAEMRAEANAFNMAERAARLMSIWTDSQAMPEAFDRVSEQIHALAIGRS
jgi:glycosyltransferase involved in cell wall biosynthesis